MDNESDPVVLVDQGQAVYKQRDRQTDRQRDWLMDRQTYKQASCYY